uniref:Putative flagellar associated protein n=1 Tax=Toxoplasma gondii COUG TaxID=1074873 RepID=A0A2G8Y5Y1_TOXGO|nr:putative flagellar associated protein [Toxoplasma gondii COUG]
MFHLAWVVSREIPFCFVSSVSATLPLALLPVKTLCQKRSLQMQKEVEQRGLLRLEQSRLIQKVKEESQLMEEYVVEIDRLNNVINVLEKEMLNTKRVYQTAIESRNLTGIQLIDRQAQDKDTEKKSQRALHEKEQDVNTLRLQLQEVERQLLSKKRRAKEVPILTAEVENLKTQLQEEKRLAENISRKLENPTEGRQWQELGGEDPDMETLEAKYRVIEQRFRSVKSELIDQDLRLEDLTELTEKQKARAAEEHSDAIRIRSEILRLHGKLIEMNRRMKVTMSELTLYKEYLPRLKQLQAEIAQSVENARENVFFGRPATPNAEEELADMLKREVARNQILYAAKLRTLEEQCEVTTLR